MFLTRKLDDHALPITPEGNYLVDASVDLGFGRLGVTKIAVV